MASSRSDDQPRAFDVVDSDVTESEGIRRQIKQTRERLSAVLAHHAHLREDIQCIASEQDYLNEEARHIAGRIREERQSYVKSALEQAMREIHDDFVRLRSESEIVIAAVDDLRVEKAALNAALVQQTLALLDSRQSDILRIAEGTGQSVCPHPFERPIYRTTQDRGCCSACRSGAPTVSGDSEWAEWGCCRTTSVGSR